MVNLELLPNKIVALGLIVAGVIPMILFGDATALVIFGIMGVYMLFAKTNCTCIELTPRKRTTKIHQYPTGGDYGATDETEQRLLS